MIPCGCTECRLCPEALRIARLYLRNPPFPDCYRCDLDAEFRRHRGSTLDVGSGSITPNWDRISAILEAQEAK